MAENAPAVVPQLTQPVLGNVREFDSQTNSISSYVERVQLYFEANSVADDWKVAVLFNALVHTWPPHETAGDTFHLADTRMVSMQFKQQLSSQLFRNHHPGTPQYTPPSTVNSNLFAEYASNDAPTSRGHPLVMYQ